MTRPPRVVRLTERVPRAVRLRRADVDFLLARHREHVQVTPTGERGVYRLTARGFAGVIPTPNRRLALRPKLPAANLGYLLDPVGPLKEFDDRSAPVDAATLLDVLAGRLAVLMRDRAAAGLHCDYAERAAVTPFLKGQLDVAAQVRAGSVRRDRLHCRYDEFTPDVPCNRLAKAAADRLLVRLDIDVRVKGALRDALGGWSD